MLEMTVALVAVSVLAAVILIAWFVDRRSITHRLGEVRSERDHAREGLAEADQRLAIMEHEAQESTRQLGEARQRAEEEHARLAEARERESTAARRAEEAERGRRSVESLLEVNRGAWQELDERERRLREDRRRLDEGLDRLERERIALHEEQEEVDEARQDLDRRGADIAAELERVAGMTTDQARDELVATVDHQAREVAETEARRINEDIVENAEQQARWVLAEAMQRCSSEMVADTVVTVVPLPSEEMKGRIIGREGRNIRTFEQVSGVTVVVDDTPGTVLLSCFDPMRREVARQALVDLITDGRIHPLSIERAYQRALDRIEETCVEAARQALNDAAISDLAPALLPILGALRFRTSYGQEVLAHCVECARLAVVVAAEIGADVETCRRAAFLHDLGKALTPAVEGSHALMGAELARRHGESEEVVHAIAAHHEEVEPTTVTDVVVRIADAVSASRPGARRDSLEAHVRRMEAIEDIATSHRGVERAYALQAGRELEILVDPGQVDDAEASRLAREIALEVGEHVTVPGRSRVTVIRSFRAVETVGEFQSRD